MAEDAQRAREQEFRTLAENSPDMIVRYDRDCRRIYVNPTTERVTGHMERELLGKTPTEISTLGQAARRYHELLQGVLATGKPCEIDMNVPRGEEVACFSYNLVPEFDQGGMVGSVLVIAHDITERKRAETELFAREQEYRALVDNSPNTISRYDLECRRTFANPELFRQTNTTPEQLLGKTPEEFPGGLGGTVYMQKLQEALTGEHGIEFELEWQSASGQEYATLIRLAPERNQNQEVVSVLAVGHDITEINRSRRKIHNLAFFDTLTGLPNRALFNDRARHALVDAGWHGHLVGLMLLDLDHFKLINDSMGHAAGDELLREVASRLRGSIRDYDTVARLGGDEFVIILPEVRAAEDVGAIAAKIHASFSAPFMIEGRELHVTTSLGISMYPYDETEIEDLLKYADTALYHAKAKGRNNFQFYSGELTARAKERLSLENDLRKCLEHDELELFYQPKVDLTNSAVVGAEALLRWNHPRLGLVGPDRFIGIAEDTGLIVSIGEWVLKNACRAARRYNEEGRQLVKIAVNLSARQFNGNNLVAMVRDTLAETGCRPEWIELEITESLLLDNQKEILQTLEAFRDMGLTIALDDFGTGFSAMGYLIRFPINTLKIDRSFILNLVTHQDSASLVRAITSLAHSLRMTLVAEGVEAQEQAEFLKNVGCMLAQGYLFGKPMPQRQFENVLRAMT
ncbi:MAG: hypothetical protein A2051_06885 [Desulfovibrionales bacterium GWA2_65_9]|nr:MAG: hypothetical protein A2051_06885 [Desulfovibrionales bacterium GWA2_65_9]